MSTAAWSGQARILIASADMALSNLRKQVIEQEPGVNVTITRNKQHALALLHNDGFELLLLCNSVSRKTKLDFATIYRGRNPDGKILVIEGRESQNVLYDAILLLPVTPHELITAIRALLSRT